MSELIVKQVAKAFPDKQVLADINLVVHQGEIVCLLGVSGVGKTTLFNIIAGLNRPDEGAVLLDGADITGVSGKVSYMLQKDLLLPYKTIEDNIGLPLVLKGQKKKAARAEVARHLAEFGLEHTGKRYPKDLSGGMRQRAALLRTYLFSQDVTLLDEPFSALDALTKADIHRWYLDVQQHLKLTTLFITHDIDEAIVLSDRIYLLQGVPGRLTKEIKLDKTASTAAEFSLSPQFLAYKREILTELGRK
jgi:ABC-type nitrate/sulfonate/bicarbonate transport system ATPase subunit